MDEAPKVQVAVRVRPLLEKFGEAYSVKCAKKAAEDTICMTHPTDESANSGKQSTFTYNYVFDEEDSQNDVYESMKELVDSTLDGHHATIFTYGQTGSGKTHTVLGKLEQEEGKVAIGQQTGLFMRVLDDLIKFKNANTKRSHVVITLSILEIHREVLKDLLNKNKVVDLSRNRFGDEAVPNVTLTTVNSLDECFDVFQIGNSNRSVAETKMNDVSSRSHAVFIIDVLQQEKHPDNPDAPDPAELYAADFKSSSEPMFHDDRYPIKKSRLTLVDLAGSERLKKSQAEGSTLKETQAINQSLAALGNVVNALYEGKTFVGYRDSKLTLLLKSSFEKANAKVMLICNISPISQSFSESQGSLRFADRLMGLKAKNVFMLDADSEADYLESLREHAELCADIRMAIASFDLKLQGEEKLKKLKGADGNFSAASIERLAEDHKKHAEELKVKRLNSLKAKITSRRSMVEEREARATAELGWQLKLDEQDLLLQAVANEQIAFEEDNKNKKEEHKALKKINKNADKALTALKEICEEKDKNIKDFGAEINALVKSIEEQYSAHVQSTKPIPVCEDLPPPPVQLSSDLPPEAASLTSEILMSMDESSLTMHHTDSAMSMTSSLTRSMQDQHPDVDPRLLRALAASKGRPATKEEIQAAHEASRKARELREKAWKGSTNEEWERRKKEVQQQLMAHEDAEEDDDDGSDSEDEETKAARRAARDAKKKEEKAMRLEKKRMKELLKASGLKKSEISKILERMPGGDDDKKKKKKKKKKKDKHDSSDSDSESD